MRPSTFIHTLLVGTALCIHASAQARGPASSLASGLSLETDAQATNVLDPLLLKAPQAQTSAPQPFNAALLTSGPNYSLSAMFGSHANKVRIDAHSSGNAIIPAPDMKGVPGLSGASSWMGVMVSVGRRQDGGQVRGLQNTPVAAAAAGGRDPRSDIFSHYLDNSVGLSSSTRGLSFLEQSREDMGFAGAVDENVDAFDFGLGVNRFSTRASMLFPSSTRYFFSLTPASASSLGSGFAVDSFGNGVSADPCAIYLIEWQAGSGWTVPLEWRGRDELGLTAGENVDALEVARNNGCVVISTQVVEGRSQLLIQTSAWTPLLPLQGEDQSSGAPYLVTERIGLVSTTSPGTSTVDDLEDIDGVCILEPEDGLLGTHFGTPAVPASGPGTVASDLGLSVTSHAPSPDAGSVSGPDRLEMQVSGWGGLPQDQPQIVAFLGTVTDPADAMDWQSAGWAVLDAGLRWPGESVFGLSTPITINQGADLHVVGVIVSGNQLRLSSWTAKIRISN